MPYLREDYRSSVDTGVGHIDYLWQLSFRDDPGESVWVIWDADSFPYIPEYPIYMHFIASETPPDSENWLSATPITEQESVYIPVEQSVFFSHCNDYLHSNNKQKRLELDHINKNDHPRRS